MTETRETNLIEWHHEDDGSRVYKSHFAYFNGECVGEVREYSGNVFYSRFMSKGQGGKATSLEDAKAHVETKFKSWLEPILGGSHLIELIELRDKFIVRKGLWHEFVDGLDSSTLR